MVMHSNKNACDRLVGVVIGKYRKTDFADNSGLESEINERNEVVLGEHNTLCETGGTRGIKKHLHSFFILGFHFAIFAVTFLVKLLSVFEEFSEGKEFSVVFVAVEGNEIFNVRKLVSYLAEYLFALLVTENDLVVTVVDNVNEVGRGKLLINGAEYALALKSGEISKDPIIAVFGAATDVGSRHTERVERGAEIIGLHLEFAEGYLANTFFGAEFISDSVTRLINGDL
jgi:hypothetical protein